MAFRLPDCPPSAPAHLPGVAEAQVLPSVLPTLDTQLAYETEGRDNLIDAHFFQCMGTRPLVQYSWPHWACPPNRFPMPHTDVSGVAAAFAVPLEDLSPLLPASRRLRPLRWTPVHGLILVMACQHHRSGMGRYQELGILLPVALDSPALLPPWRLLHPLRRPELALFPLELPVDRQRPAEAGLRLAGLPHMVAHAEFALGSQTGLASMELGAQRLAGLEVVAPAKYTVETMDLSFQQLSIFEGRLIRQRIAVIAEGYRGLRGSAKVEFGEHPRFQRFRGLRLLSRPVEVRVCSRQNWIAGTPEDLGPA